MPYFEETSNGTINEQIFWGLQYLNNQSFEPDEDTPGQDVIPDGAVTFHEANNQELHYRIQINDGRLPEYHRYTNFKATLLKKI